MHANAERAPARPPFIEQFALLTIAIYLLEAWVVRSPLAARHPDRVGLAVAIDLAVVVPLLYWALVVRPSRAPVLRVAAVFLASLVCARLVLPAEQRHWLSVARLAGVPLELVVIWLVVVKVRRAARGFGAAGGAPDIPERIHEALRGAFAYPAVVEIFATELAMLYYALLSWRRAPHVSAGATPFSLHRRSGLVPLLVALTAVAVVELVVAHLLLHGWSPRAAWIASVPSALGVLWLVGFTRAIVLRPVLVEPGRVVARGGVQWTVELPLPLVARADTGRVRAPHRRAPEHLQLAGLGTPTALLTLREPVTARGAYGRERVVRTIALTVDDPADFRVALARAGWSDAADADAGRA